MFLDADAVIKCLASAVSTGILLFMSPAISGTTMTPLTIPGGLLVFISSWLYVKSPAEKSAESEDTLPKVESPSRMYSFGISVSRTACCQVFKIIDGFVGDEDD